MATQFESRHIPALFAATVMTFGGMWSYLDARTAMLEFGFPERIAATPAAAAVMHINNARTQVLGICMYTFYFRGQLAACDTMLAVMGAYAGIVDSYVVWREGNPRKAAFRLASSWLLSAVGFAGWTAGR
ncbi:hypothetical protein GGR56DRAFT_669771 [Xylariaceae sp. FL0804]|nr:hypothetical protein GGR56DRAFT_669771 [Xylariaceae sp. FL0804]